MTRDAFPDHKTAQQFCLDAYGDAYDELLESDRIDPDKVTDRPSPSACVLVSATNVKAIDIYEMC